MRHAKTISSQTCLVTSSVVTSGVGIVGIVVGTVTMVTGGGVVVVEVVVVDVDVVSVVVDVDVVVLDVVDGLVKVSSVIGCVDGVSDDTGTSLDSRIITVC